MCACTSICFLSLHMPVCKVSNFLGLIFFFSFSIFLLFYVVPNLPPLPSQSISFSWKMVSAECTHVSFEQRAFKVLQRLDYSFILDSKLEHGF